MRPVALAAAVVLVTACGDGDAGGDIPPPDAALVQSGAVLYAENCAECHGEDLRGTDQGPSFLSEVYEPSHHGDGAFLLAVQRGSPAHHWQFGDMPPIEGLTTEDVDAIVAFVRETQLTEGFESYRP